MTLLTFPDSDRRDDPATLVAVALGDRPADLVVRGGTLANVYTGELLPGWAVAVAGSRIALVGPEAEDRVGPGTAVVDAAGGVIAPGFIDSHTHLDHLVRLDHYLAAAIPTGLTAVVTETDVVAMVGGLPAVEAFLTALPDLPATVLATAPVICYLLSDRGDGRPTLDEEEMARLLEEPAVVGLGEVYWPAVLEHRPELPMLIAKAAALGKTVEGHTAGARGARLAAVVAAGVDSCHEPITADQVRARLRLGLFTMVRDGSIRRDSGALRGALTGLDTRRLMLASDVVWPSDLLARGYMDESARAAVAMGLSPMQALQAITLTPAEHFHLDGELGGLAPGRQADVVVLPVLEQFRPRTVIARGRVVARDGEMLLPVSPVRFPPALLPAPVLPPGFGRGALVARAPGSQAEIRVIAFTGEIVTEERRRSVSPLDGRLAADPAGDLLKVAALDRRGQGHLALGFVSGYGLRRGAVAASLCFDTTNLVLLGADDDDMVTAARRLEALGGGIVVAAEGRVLAELPLPMGGVISDEPVPTLAKQLSAVQEALRELGCVRASPLLSLLVLTFTAIPSLRIRERGLWHVRDNRVVSLLTQDDAA